MLIRILVVLAVAFLLASALFAQSDRGTITGTVLDAGGAVIPGARVTAVNPETGVEYQAQTTMTGNYTIPSMPAGTYNLLVESPGFSRYEQQGIRVRVAETARVDVTLQVGAVTESITVTSDAPLLKTESAAQSTTVERAQLNDLPLNFAIGAGAIRNPLSFVQLSPGASIRGWNDIRVNGNPSGTYKIIFEGQDTTSTLDARVSDELQPSVEAIEEFTLQSTNYAAEFGEVGGGLFNFTSRSGTNEFHGSLYDYWAHDAFGAGIPFTDDGQGGHVKPEVRRHDFGGSIGGPVILPKLYNGRGRTFFFFNYEQFRDVQYQYPGFGTVPTQAYRNGDFAAALTGRNLGTDGLGRAILENTIYDPGTSRTIEGRIYRDPFPGNVIPSSLFDQVALKIQNLIPAPENSGLINNYQRQNPYRKIQQIPSIKVDHNFGASGKLAAYYSTQRTDKDVGTDGFPDPISARRDLFIRSHTVRLNYDHTVRPTLLLHLGAGYQRYRNPDSSPPENMAFDPVAELGLRGGFDTGFPRIQSLSSNYGGMGNNMGPSNRNLYLQDKVTSVASASWIVANHTVKYGGEWKFDDFTNRNTNNVVGTWIFNAAETGLPATQGQNLQGGSIGFPYASFLLGMVNNANVSNPQDPQYRRYALGLFIQDTWKLTPKLTVDYGLRWDYQPAPKELHDRTSMFAPTIANPSAGGLPGAMLYAGSGPGRCDCDISKTYPWAFGPRLGLAYQMNPKTVIRGGGAISYGQVSQFSYIGGGNSLGMGFNTVSFSTPAYGEPALLLRNGMVYDVNDLLAATYDVGLRPSPGQLNSPPALVDWNAGRPPRLFNWNISVQREITPNLIVEAAYVGNRTAWWRADGLNQFNATDGNYLQQFGLDISNPDHRKVLTSRIDSALAKEWGFTKPYPGFPNSATVAQSLRPFPQFGNLSSLWAPLGNTWYDALQVKATKRFSRGLSALVAYTWSKSLATVETHSGTTVPLNNVYNRRLFKTLSSSDQPHVFVASFNYETPRMARNGFTRWGLSNWTISGIVRYQSGFPIRVPDAQNNLSSLVYQGSFMNRVPGAPLFLHDLNSKDFDPNKDFVLNPNAWQDPAPGEWGTSAAYYSDYRYARRPDEQLGIGKVFPIKERMRIHVRFEFFNVFNRVYLNDPDRANALATQKVDANGMPVSGFGRINTGSVYSPPRSGQMVLRFEF